MKTMKQNSQVKIPTTWWTTKIIMMATPRNRGPQTSEHWLFYRFEIATENSPYKLLVWTMLYSQKGKETQQHQHLYCVLVSHGLSTPIANTRWWTAYTLWCYMQRPVPFLWRAEILVGQATNGSHIVQQYKEFHWVSGIEERFLLIRKKNLGPSHRSAFTSIEGNIPGPGHQLGSPEEGSSSYYSSFPQK